MATSDNSPFRRLLDLIFGRSGSRVPGPKKPVDSAERLAAEVFRVQEEVIRRAFDGAVATGRNERGERTGAGAPSVYLYRPDHLLVRAAFAEPVAQYVARRTDTDPDSVERLGSPVDGLELLRFPGRRGVAAGEVPSLLDEIEREFGADSPEGPVATPDHVVYVTFPKLCPATEPEVPAEPTPFPAPSSDPGLGRGVRVSVVDTGLWEPAVTDPELPWLEGVTADPSDLEAVNPQHLHPYAGHGTFVAGVVRCMAPATDIEVEGVLTNGGAVYESDIIAQLHEALRERSHPQLISISAGTHTRNNIALLSFEMLAAAHGLDDGEATLIVAAAGNDGSSDPFWPAAFPWVVSVGAVDDDGGVADYSNVGRWVDVYARGTDLVNAFPTGTYVCYEPPHVGEVRQFDSLARWSGTSFSTPIVTGLIAARMSATGESATQAWASVKAAGHADNDPRAGKFVRVGPLT